jgi:hypothetical protein
MSSGHFAPVAQRTPRFRLRSCLPQLSLRPPALPGTAVCGHAFAGAAPDLSIGITQVPATAPGHRSRAEDLHAGRKRSGVLLPLWGLPRGYPAGSLLGGRPVGRWGQAGGLCPGRAQRRRSPQPSRQDDALGREHRKYPLQRAPTRACWWGSLAARCPTGQAASRARGGAPAAPSPPRGARGPAPPQAPATAPTSRPARPQTGLASATAVIEQHYAP